ncbi:hypothetical protein SETIT_2G233600v2 [Setaria italica]|nr:hypothetical protein SETIT_2G233600v2 [Setaria italica]
MFGGITIVCGILGTLSGGIILDKIWATIPNAFKCFCFVFPSEVSCKLTSCSPNEVTCAHSSIWNELMKLADCIPLCFDFVSVDLW